MIFKEKNPKFQCFNCGTISEASKWNEKTNEVYENNQALLPRDYIENNHDMTTAGIEESNPNLASFICPICESGPMADELIYVPDGEKVVVRAMAIRNKNNVTYEYDIYLATEIRPFHKLKENPIRDYSDYIENIGFFKTIEEMINTINKEHVLDFIKKYHHDLLPYIDDKGLFIYPAWIPYGALKK